MNSIKNILIIAYTLVPYDAIGNDVEAMYNILSKNYNCLVYAVDNHIKNFLIIDKEELHDILNDEKSLVIYHHSCFWKEGEELLNKAKGKIVFKYHNITPPFFFEKYNHEYINACSLGKEQTDRLIRNYSNAFWLCDSSYNASELIGVPKEKISVCSPFNKTEKWAKSKPDMNILHTLNSSAEINILFVGLIAPNKGHLFLVDIINSYVKNFDYGIKLRIIGEFDERFEGYNQEIHSKINSLNLKNNIELIGEINDSTLLSYYMGSDFFISASEHEGFLVPTAEAQYLGLPIIARASYAVPEKIGENQVLLYDNPTQYAAAIHLLYKNNNYYGFLREFGYKNFNKRFSNNIVTEKFIRCLRDNLRLFNEDSIGSANNYKCENTNSMEKSLKKKRKSRLYVDVTNTANTDAKSGIQRVSWNIVRELYRMESCLLEPLAVTFAGGCLHAANNWLEHNGFLPKWRQNDADGTVDLQPGDIYLQMDLLMDRIDQFESLFEKMENCGVHIVIMVFDILAVRMPECFAPHWQQPLWRGMPLMTSWLHYIVEYADAVIAISRTVRDDVREWIAKNHGRRIHEISFSYFHLGADFQGFDSAIQVQSKHRELPNKAYLLMVGTIEIRKNHVLAIEAMDILWKRGIDLALCVAGKEGWMAETAMQRLRGADNKNLWFFEQATDEELRLLYADAKGLLFVSRGEGFGLPLIEAASYAKPVLCSDIPIFHEIAGEFAFYVNIGSAEQLANGIEEWWKQSQQGNIPDSSGIPRLSWAESAQQLLDVVSDF